MLQEKFGEEKANTLQGQFRAAGTNSTSLLQFYFRSQMTAEDFAQIEGDLTVTNAAYLEGLINVNTASAVVLACVPGIGAELAPQLVSARQAKGTGLKGMGWVTEVLTEETGIAQAGPHLTSRCYQFTADIAAVGHNGRGYRRTMFVFDTSDGPAQVLYRRDLTRLGWALGALTRQQLALGAAGPYGNRRQYNAF